jgi:hypothetical protein
MRKLIGTVAMVFIVFAAVTRPNDAAVVLRGGARVLAEAANALLDVLVGMTH